MTFPFWKDILINKEQMFKNLQSQTHTVIPDTTTNYPVLHRTYPDDYLESDSISNHFSEQIRINCRFRNFATPMEVFNELVKTNNSALMLSKYELREYIYESTKECNTFNPSYCLWIIHSLIGKNAKILDPSSGWGDRLIAALASDAELYHGYDPNVLLKSCYNQIIKSFNASKNTEVKIRYKPFEDVKVTNNFYDIAITSPPYWNLEQYSTDASQSNVKYQNYDNWLTQFLTPYLLKMIKAVKVNGYIVIYIENFTNNNVQYNIRDFTKKVMSEQANIEFVKMMGLIVNVKSSKKNYPRWSLIYLKKY